MNGAESLVRTLLRGGVDTCFANPGTSEMHFVSALDRIPGVRCVLGLFEGVVTGAADGYYRMADKPAATLLHLGPGLANGFANLHNAKRANSGIVNIVGEHATFHIHLDSPLTSDIASVARPVSAWLRTSKSARAVGADAAEAITVANSPKGQIATLVLPADTAWTEGGVVGVRGAAPVPAPVPAEAIEEVIAALRAGGAMMLLGNRALRAGPMALAMAIGAKTGAEVTSIGRSSRIERGAGRVTIGRVPNPIENLRAKLADKQVLILVDEEKPVTFFGFPGRDSELVPDHCRTLTLAASGDDIMAALQEVAEAFGAKASDMPVQALARPELPSGELTLEKVAQALGALMPENAIVCDESITSGRNLFPATTGAPPHDWLQLCGGAIGMGIPLATGAAVACPDRKVINLEADGSGMYTLQALWTQARERLDVVTVIWANRSYKILHGELVNVGAGAAGKNAGMMLDLDDPALDWVSLAKGMGVDGARATTMEEFIRAMRAGLEGKGPYLVEVVL
jgi:acetolactate synthase I/II/III large subunit